MKEYSFIALRQGMLKVLRAKFEPGSALADMLLSTGNAFLLEHNPRVGRDSVWSNDGNGTGRNWLGLQLMLLRDELRHTSSERSSWTTFIKSQVDIGSGDYWPGRRVAEGIKILPQG